MAQEEPEPFHMKDLFIDVKLEACVGGTTFDFLGRKLFSTEFFRQGVGFGIINIDIEINTSLQPIVTVTFKDLYGLTVFGGQSRNADDDNQSHDYSVLFNWPPPKFLFSFKGYLGKPASWVLNLKRTSTSFNSSDGSYEVKCEFVPNQWGFFADLPFLYLLAAKKLRKDALGSKPTKEQLANLTSVFDLIKIGKSVEVKTLDTTKEFDGLVSQLGGIKSNMAGSILLSKSVDSGENIDGNVNNRKIKGFVTMSIPKIENLTSEALNNPLKMEQKLGNPSELEKINTFLLLSIKFDGRDNFGAVPRDYGSINQNDPEVSKQKTIVLELIDANLRLIEDEIKRLVYQSSKTKLQKITIGEIFSQMAGDSGYIMGSILDSGLDGHRKSGFTSRRNELVSEGRLIGESFPMIIDKDGKEVPATQVNLQEDIGVDSFEMKFVNNFINAITEGIARDLISDDSTTGKDDGLLNARINNVEMTSSNPYKSYYDSIAQNILVRGGIVGFMTRSGDPNIPGDYGSTLYFDNDGKQQIEELATRDATNISDNIIKGLSDIDALLIKRFCNFMLKFYSADGEYALLEDGSEGPSVANVGFADYPVKMSTKPDEFLTFRRLWTELRNTSTLQNVSVDENGTLVYGVVEFSNPPEGYTNPPTNEGELLNAQNPLSFVDDNFTATRIMNNKIAYIYPAAVLTTNAYYAILFRGEDNKKAQEANSSITDAEYRTEDKDDTSLFSNQSSPLGYIPINSKFVDDDDDEIMPRIETLLDYRDKLVVLDFDKLKNPGPFFYGATESIDPGSPIDFLWNNDIAADSSEAITMAETSERDIDIAGNIGYTVCYHSPAPTEGGGNGYVFGFFEDNNQGRNQRIFVRKMCSILLDNINRIDGEKNQVIGSVLGKASEQRDTIYKQMHTLFHQWQTLAYSDKGNSSGCIPANLDEDDNLATTLENRFSSHRNMLDGEYIEIDGRIVPIEGDEDGNSEIQDGTFIYDYPLQRIRGIGGNGPIRVRDSIINLEPLYKPNGDTTVLNIIQQVCTKNNFLFIPIPGNPGYLNVKDIYSPSREPANIVIRNFFHVLFTPTPESRAKVSNKDSELSLAKNHEEYKTNSFVIKYGHPDNQIVSNIQVGTDDNKVTAESIVNLQRLVDNENQNKKVTTDCSMLPVLAGRSYKASVDMLGNAQVYPMQFFFLKNSPLFGGLYQVMKVKHTIDPNNMKTSVEGIRMRFSSDGYGAVEPITLQTFEALDAPNNPANIKKGFDAADRARLSNPEAAPIDGSGATFDSVVDEGDNVPVGGYNKNKIEAAVKRKGYKWFDKAGDYELNIVGVRNTQTGSAVTNKFDDYITLSYKVNGEWKFWSWPATTQPGDDYMLKPEAKGGTAIVKPGQYINSHVMRLHAGQYEALGQNGPITVYRDNNKNLNYDLDPKSLVTGSGFGINIHRSSPTGTSANVNNWSAGCQVFANIKDFNSFMSICRKSKALFGNKFTYTLIESKDIS